MPQRACIKAFHAAWVRDHTAQTTRRRVVGAARMRVRVEAARGEVTVGAAMGEARGEAARGEATVWGARVAGVMEVGAAGRVAAKSGLEACDGSRCCCRCCCSREVVQIAIVARGWPRRKEALPRDQRRRHATLSCCELAPPPVARATRPCTPVTRRKRIAPLRPSPPARRVEVHQRGTACTTADDRGTALTAQRHVRARCIATTDELRRVLPPPPALRPRTPTIWAGAR